MAEGEEWLVIALRPSRREVGWSPRSDAGSRRLADASGRLDDEAQRWLASLRAVLGPDQTSPEWPLSRCR